MSVVGDSQPETPVQSHALKDQFQTRSLPLLLKLKCYMRQRSEAGCCPLQTNVTVLIYASAFKGKWKVKIFVNQMQTTENQTRSLIYYNTLHFSCNLHQIPLLLWKQEHDFYVTHFSNRQLFQKNYRMLLMFSVPPLTKNKGQIKKTTLESKRMRWSWSNSRV